MSFTYTPTGQRATMTDAGGATTYTYNALNQLTQKATPEGTLNYTYDAAGNLASMTSGDGDVSVDYTWDKLNRLSAVTDNNLSGTGGTTTYTYDGANNVVTATYPNGVESTYQYDPENRVTSETAGSTGYLYTRGPTGNLTSATELSGRSVTWSFDGIYRLTGETIANAPSKANGSVGYTLDPVGNRLSDASTLTGVSSGSFSYNPDDELQSETYDANGNVTAANGNTYQYDSQNELVGMNGGGVTIAYDGDGNRVSKTVNGVTTRYLVDDLNPTGYPQVVEETGATIRTYTYGLQRISENQIVNGTMSPSFYGYDGMGSVRQLTNAAGAVTDTYEYDAFGNEIAHTGSTPDEMLYRGERWDSDLGLYYLRARWYNPQTGRFMSRDTGNGVLTDPETLHKYLYADGDPVDGLDPSGRLDLAATAELDLSGPVRDKLVLAATGAAVACILNEAGDLLGGLATNFGSPIQSITYGLCTAQVNKCTNGTQPGAVYYHYGYASNAASFTGGLRPGSYATTIFGLTGEQAQKGLALPARPTPPDAVYIVRPLPCTPIIGPQTVAPDNGQPGGLPEVIFPDGTAPGTVGLSIPILRGGLPLPAPPSTPLLPVE